jgi:hypothetical protein
MHTAPIPLPAPVTRIIFPFAEFSGLFAAMKGYGSRWRAFVKAKMVENLFGSSSAILREGEFVVIEETFCRMNVDFELQVELMSKCKGYGEEFYYINPTLVFTPCLHI